MKQIKAGLIAATPVDTRFGLRFLNTLNVEGFTDVLSQNPEEQNYLQLHGKDELEKRCLKKCLEFEKNGVQFIVLFCNSLSSAIDVDRIRKELKIPLFTPFDFYRELAGIFHHFGVVTANSTGLLGIENFITKQNLQAKIIGYANLEIVRQIEAKILPEDIILNNGLIDFLNICHVSNVEILLLGCTHYSYLYKELIRIQKMKNYSFEIKDIDHGLKKVIQNKLHTKIIS
ncbi:MAG: hypothetical protein ACD_28C00185G0008 [uncultured bacterium]|nr:MAG: hypothetical protein ACD_28C00185G0008 [uncultured bacterium]KKT74380.1 MAG: Asp/Glu/hydantoin racemase [Candidatus Peregrinibacteria bacterium GW2011_GWA2_44_7]